MKKHLLLAATLAVTTTASAANIYKSGSGTELTDGASWNGGVAPGAADVVNWYSTSTPAANGGAQTVASDVTWSGMGFYSIATTLNGPGRITLGADGFKISSGTGGGLVVNNAVVLGANQTWTNTSGSKSATFNGVVSGNYNLTFASSAGGLVLGGANTYTGTTSLTSGKLTIATSGSVSVGATAGLSVANGATLAVDGGLRLTSAGASIANAGTLTLSGSSVLDLGGLFNGQANGSTYQLITVGGNAVTGSFGSITGYSGNVNGVTFDNATGLLHFSAVPEPSTYGLMGAGALAAAACVRRRKRRA